MANYGLEPGFVKRRFSDRPIVLVSTVLGPQRSRFLETTCSKQAGMQKNGSEKTGVAPTRSSFVNCLCAQYKQTEHNWFSFPLYGGCNPIASTLNLKGNGFDLAHGLRTSYGDFIDCLRSSAERRDLLKNLSWFNESIYKALHNIDQSYWRDFEDGFPI